MFHAVVLTASKAGITYEAFTLVLCVTSTNTNFTYLSFLKGGVTCVSTQNGHKV